MTAATADHQPGEEIRRSVRTSLADVFTTRLEDSLRLVENAALDERWVRCWMVTAAKVDLTNTRAIPQHLQQPLATPRPPGPRPVASRVQPLCQRPGTKISIEVSVEDETDRRGFAFLNTVSNMEQRAEFNAAIARFCTHDTGQTRPRPTSQAGPR
jgi:hypothetical protein